MNQIDKSVHSMPNVTRAICSVIGCGFGDVNISGLTQCPWKNFNHVPPSIYKITSVAANDQEKREALIFRLMCKMIWNHLTLKVPMPTLLQKL